MCRYLALDMCRYPALDMCGLSGNHFLRFSLPERSLPPPAPAPGTRHCRYARSEIQHVDMLIASTPAHVQCRVQTPDC